MIPAIVVLFLMQAIVGDTRMRPREDRTIEPGRRKTFEIVGVDANFNAEKLDGLQHILSSERVEVTIVLGDAEIFKKPLNTAIDKPCAGPTNYTKVQCKGKCEIKLSPYESWCIRIIGGEATAKLILEHRLSLDEMHLSFFVAGVLICLFANRMSTNDYIRALLVGGITVKVLDYMLRRIVLMDGQYVDYVIVVASLFTGGYVLFEGLDPTQTCGLPFMVGLVIVGLKFIWDAVQLYQVGIFLVGMMTLILILVNHEVFIPDTNNSVEKFNGTPEEYAAKVKENTDQELRRLSEFIRQNPKWLSKVANQDELRKWVSDSGVVDH